MQNVVYVSCRYTTIVAPATGIFAILRQSDTTTEQAFGPSHLSQLSLDPESKSALVPDLTPGRSSVGGRGLLHLSRLVSPTGTKGPGEQWSRMEPPTGTNGGDLVPIGGSNRDKSPLPISLFFLPRASHLAQYSCCSWLGWGGVLAISSTICEDSLIPCPFNRYKG